MSPESLIAPFPTTHELALSFAGVPLRARTNDPDIWAGLVSYYRPYIVPGGGGAVAGGRLLPGTGAGAGGVGAPPPAPGKKGKGGGQEVSCGGLVLQRTTGGGVGVVGGGALLPRGVR